MKVGEARALEREFNETVAKGRVLWEQASALAARCNEIRDQLDQAGVDYDPIALLFGGDLQIDVAGPDDAEVRS